MYSLSDSVKSSRSMRGHVRRAPWEDFQLRYLAEPSCRLALHSEWAALDFWQEGQCVACSSLELGIGGAPGIGGARSVDERWMADAKVAPDGLSSDVCSDDLIAVVRGHAHEFPYGQPFLSHQPPLSTNIIRRFAPHATRLFGRERWSAEWCEKRIEVVATRWQLRSALMVQL